VTDRRFNKQCRSGYRHDLSNARLDTSRKRSAGWSDEPKNSAASLIASRLSSKVGDVLAASSVTELALERWNDQRQMTA
jgi:hypothetical protein